MGHLQFGDVGFALRFRNLLQVSTAYKSPQLDELADEIVLARFKHHFHLVGRELRLGLHHVLFATVHLCVEEHVGRAGAHTVAIDAQILAERLAEGAIAIKVHPSLACRRILELLGLGRLLFGGHIDRRAAGHQSRQGEREF